MMTVFIDVDTQLDFLFPAGALYVRGAEKVVPAIAKLNRFAASAGYPVISTTDAHAEDDPEFRSWPPHCVANTWGQRKAQATLLERRAIVPNRECRLEIEGAQQIIVEKQTIDAFQAPNLLRVLERLNAGSCVLYGVVTEICVLHAARGLLRTGRPVTLVADAVAELDAANAQKALEEIRAAGGKLATVSEVCAR